MSTRQNNMAKKMISLIVMFFSAVIFAFGMLLKATRKMAASGVKKRQTTVCTDKADSVAAMVYERLRIKPVMDLESTCENRNIRKLFFHVSRYEMPYLRSVIFNADRNAQIDQEDYEWNV